MPEQIVVERSVLDRARKQASAYLKNGSVDDLLDSLAQGRGGSLRSALIGSNGHDDPIKDSYLAMRTAIETSVALRETLFHYAAAKKQALSDTQEHRAFLNAYTLRCGVREGLASLNGDADRPAQAGLGLVRQATVGMGGLDGIVAQTARYADPSTQMYGIADILASSFAKGLRGADAADSRAAVTDTLDSLDMELSGIVDCAPERVLSYLAGIDMRLPSARSYGASDVPKVIGSAQAVVDETMMIRLSDVIGGPEAKLRLMEIVQDLSMYDPSARRNAMFNQKRSTRPNVMLYGPPGTGKSMLTEAIFNELTVACRRMGRPDPQMVKFESSLFDPFVGVSQRNLDKLIAKLNNPDRISIGVMDDADLAFGHDRKGGDRSSEAKAQVMQRVYDELTKKPYRGNSAMIAALNVMNGNVDAALRSRFEVLPFNGAATPDELVQVLKGELRDMQVPFELPAKDEETLKGVLVDYSAMKSYVTSSHPMLRYMDEISSGVVGLRQFAVESHTRPDLLSVAEYLFDIGYLSMELFPVRGREMHNAAMNCSKYALDRNAFLAVASGKGADELEAFKQAFMRPIPVGVVLDESVRGRLGLIKESVDLVLEETVKSYRRELMAGFVQRRKDYYASSDVLRAAGGGRDG
ncbi:MAG: AAA family ATPase [Nanoarchaeota archaeon]